MGELSVGQLIKIILGVLVVVAVIAGLYFAFNGKILNFFRDLPTENPTQLFGSLL